ncbi:MAG: hypothetical protein II337_03005 [Clostridia bacterium]|nr:hypothetical protein [Clostridia bacterium]
MNQLQVGFARMDVTPMTGIGLIGYYHERLANGVLDPLELNAMAIACGDDRVVLITMDQEGLTRDCCQDFKNYISQVTGLPEQAIYIHATHTHTGPYVVKDSENPLEREYYTFLYRRMGDVAKYALADLTPARMGYGVGTSPEIAFVRRYRMKDGSIQTNPGRQNPNVVEPIGITDHRVNVLRFDREDGQTLILANFGNHPDVIGGCRFSADWPGFTRRTLEQALPGSKCIFFNGAQGDVNHIDIRIPEDGFNDGYEYSRHMGRVVAGTVLQVFDKVVYADVDSLRYKQTTVHVPAKRPTPEQIEQAKIIKEIHESGRDDELPYKGMMRITVVAEAINFVELEHGPDSFEMDLSGIAIGNVVLIGIPGEPFSGIGLGLKEAEGWDLILPTCLTNGKHGYFPMQEAFDEGGYESRSSRFQAGVAEYLIAEGKKLMADLRK